MRTKQFVEKITDVATFLHSGMQLENPTLENLKNEIDECMDIISPYHWDKDHEIICKDRLYDNRNNKKYKTDDIIDGIIKRVGKIEDYLGGLLNVI